MSLRIVLMVFVTIFLGSSCSEDEVDSSYLFEADNLKVTVVKGDVTSEENGILLKALKEQEYTGKFEFSANTRAENDKFAQEKFTDKCKSIKNLDLDVIFSLGTGDSVHIKFDYLLKRGKDELQQERIVLSETFQSGESES